ncbi:hypothetical protein TI04_07960 [Achromatium sp. WMS2]|nr:hypothetical protein TI04_07960 [Achromatium sp. WMS2]
MLNPPYLGANISIVGRVRCAWLNRANFYKLDAHRNPPLCMLYNPKSLTQGFDIFGEQMPLPLQQSHGKKYEPPGI